MCWNQWKRQFKSADLDPGWGGLNLGKSFASSCYFLRCCSTFFPKFPTKMGSLCHLLGLQIFAAFLVLFSPNSSSGWFWEFTPPSHPHHVIKIFPIFESAAAPVRFPSRLFRGWIHLEAGKCIPLWGKKRLFLLFFFRKNGVFLF